MFKKGDILLCKYGGVGNYFIAKYEGWQNGDYWCIVKYITHVHVNQQRNIIGTYSIPVTETYSHIKKGKIYHLEDREIIGKVEKTDELLAKVM